MKKQTEINVQDAPMPQYKREFLDWLNRFAYFPRNLRAKFENLVYTEPEITQLRGMIVNRYRLKKSYLDRLKREA